MKKSTWAAAAVGVLLGSVGLAAEPASASTDTCVNAPSDAACTGQSPGDLASKSGCYASATMVPQPTPDVPVYIDRQTGAFYEVELWYSRTCQTNWAVVQGSGGNSFTEFSGKVRRIADSFRGYVMEHAGTHVLLSNPYQAYVQSPMVYAPTNYAQACLSLKPYTGDPDQTICTRPH